MAGKKPRNFAVATEYPPAMFFYHQPATGPEQQVSHDLLLARLAEDGVVVSPAVSAGIGNDGAMAIPAGAWVVGLAFNASTAMTVSVGTTPGGTDVLDGIGLVSGWNAPEVLNMYFPTAGSLYFTLSTGSITVHLKKL
jgi:hypothetical protein